MEYINIIESNTLTTKNAVELLIEGTLRLRVCRYCLNVGLKLSELNEILEIAIDGGLHEVTIHDMMASFYPFKMKSNSSFPNKICEECLNSALKAYLFTQQCERAERAMRNCFEDIEEKYDKLDPVEPVKKRGKRKLNPNKNIIYVEKKYVLDYAKPLINIINTNSVLVDNVDIGTLECQKCWKTLPTPQALVVHEESHPKNMWYNCKLCGKSFVKRFHLKQHIKKTHNTTATEEVELDSFKCNECGEVNENLGIHYQHIEKHKFKSMLHNIINKRTEHLCVLCLEDGSRMTALNGSLSLHGGYPDLNGEYTIRDILSSVFHSIPFNNIGTRVCDVCLNHAINSYIFTCKLEHVKHRLNKCVSNLLSNLDSLKNTKRTVMIEISNDVVLPIVDKLDIEPEPEIEVLEDEFREEIREESSESEEENLAKQVTKTYSRNNLVNGYSKHNICNEFLTFKPKIKAEKCSPKCYYNCPICNKYFISDYFLKKHIKRHNNVLCECKRCSERFKSKFHLFEHTKMVHVLKSSSYVCCEVCGRCYSSSHKLRKHQQSHRKKECHLCNKYYRNQRGFVTHVQRHILRYRLYTNKLKQMCSFCEKTCANENELSLHVNKVHIQMKPYHCDMCDQSFYTERNMNSHKKLHSLPSKEACQFCSKEFKNRRTLVIHVRKHIGIKPHACPVCKDSFYSESQMKKHMKTSHGGKFWCTLCKAIFNTSTCLKLHLYSSTAHYAV